MVRVCRHVSEALAASIFNALVMAAGSTSETLVNFYQTATAKVAMHIIAIKNGG
jgi:hypothetical protein